MNFCYFSHDLSVDFSRDLFVALKKKKKKKISWLVLPEKKKA